MRRLFLAVLMTAVIAVSGLTGCGLAENRPADKLELQYSMEPNLEADYQRAREIWNQLYSDDFTDSFQTEEEMRTYLGTVFSSDLVDQLLTESPAAKSGDGTDGVSVKTRLSAEADKTGDESKYKITVEVLDAEDETKVAETKEAEFVYENVQGHWLFTSFPTPVGISSPMSGKQDGGQVKDEKAEGAEDSTVLSAVSAVKERLADCLKAFRWEEYDSLRAMIRDERDLNRNLASAETGSGKDSAEKTIMKSYRNLVNDLFGGDAWENVSYTITDKSDDENEWSTFRVSLKFNDMGTSPAGYGGFYFDITDRYGAWNPTELCSYTFTPRQQTAAFESSEAVYRGICAGTTETELAALLGEPITIMKDEADSRIAIYVYKDAEYTFYRSEEEEGVSYLESISVFDGDWETIRSIRLGDRLDSVMAVFPSDRDYSSDADGVFYGENPLDGQGGSYSDNVLIVTGGTAAEPFLRFEFDKGLVKRATYVFHSL